MQKARITTLNANITLSVNALMGLTDGFIQGQENIAFAVLQSLTTGTGAGKAQIAATVQIAAAQTPGIIDLSGVCPTTYVTRLVDGFGRTLQMTNFKLLVVQGSPSGETEIAYSPTGFVVDPNSGQYGPQIDEGTTGDAITVLVIGEGSFV